MFVVTRVEMETACSAALEESTSVMETHGLRLMAATAFRTPAELIRVKMDLINWCCPIAGVLSVGQVTQGRRAVMANQDMVVVVDTKADRYAEGLAVVVVPVDAAEHED